MSYFFYMNVNVDKNNNDFINKTLVDHGFYGARILKEKEVQRCLFLIIFFVVITIVFGSVADLPLGWVAYREIKGSKWERKIQNSL